jgi:hypothetical protein
VLLTRGSSKPILNFDKLHSGKDLGVHVVVLVKCTVSYSKINVWGLILCFQKDGGSDSFAMQLTDETHWNDLVIIIAVICNLYLTCVCIFL